MDLTVTPQSYLSDVVIRSINSGFALLLIAILSFIVYLSFKRKFDSNRQKTKFKYRIVYIAILIFILVLVRIWIEGFTHIFTMLSLVAAGLVVANKESIMNITGWFIINWRGLFSSGDSIQITNITGYIVSVKLLYFKIYETSALGNGKATGRIIKLPNAMVISNPITIFTSDDFFMLHQVKCTTKLNNQLMQRIKKYTSDVDKIISALYEDNVFLHKKHDTKSKSLSSLIDPVPSIEIQPVIDRDDIVTIEVNFYCRPQDYLTLKQQILIKMLGAQSSQAK